MQALLVLGRVAVAERSRLSLRTLCAFECQFRSQLEYTVNI
jgi:hypothetical protein